MDARRIGSGCDLAYGPAKRPPGTEVPPSMLAIGAERSRIGRTPLISAAHDHCARRVGDAPVPPLALPDIPQEETRLGTAVTRLSRPLGAIGGAVLILGGVLPVALVAAASTPVINEFSASTAGNDVEYVEVLGAPLTSLSDLKVLEIEGDTGATSAPIGTIDEVISLGSTDAEGRLVVTLAVNALENGTVSLLLVQGFTGALGADLDTNDDGTFDVSPWTALVDGVAVNDGGATDRTYAATLGVSYDGQPFAPGGASRIPEGTDTDTVADWVRNDFDLAGIPSFTGTPVVGEAYNTPGTANAVVAPRLAVSDVASAEGASGTTTFQFTVSLGVAASNAVTFDIATADGTATSPSDYT
jgi:hypothetical protein